jgi:hypothetical protein
MEQPIIKTQAETKIMPSNDETKIAGCDNTIEETYPGDKTCDGQTSFITGSSQNLSRQVTIVSPDFSKTKESTIDENFDENKTSILFGISDIQKKIDNEFANIPDDYEDHLEPDQMSQIIKDHLPSRTEAEKIRVNRNFLKDAEPFRLESLAENLKNTRNGIPTGFKSLDQFIIIPPNAVTLIVSRPKHGKTCFMLNMLMNICHLLRGKRFLFYSYEEPKWDIFLKLINICGTRQFTIREEHQSNLDRWKYEFNRHGVADIKKKAIEDLEYIGLKNFLEISTMVQVIDSNHNCLELMDSIRAFGKTFDIGAVFIDSLLKIRLDDEKKPLDRRQQLQEISANLKKIAAEIQLPIILSTSLITPAKGIAKPEYDDLIEENLSESGSPDQNANLVIGLQNYARSKLIGSNINQNFKSNFLDEPLKKAEPMPDYLKDMVHKTILLAKVMANKIGPEPETELIFHKQLLKIEDGN